MTRTVEPNQRWFSWYAAKCLNDTRYDKSNFFSREKSNQAVTLASFFTQRKGLTRNCRMYSGQQTRTTVHVGPPLQSPVENIPPMLHIQPLKTPPIRAAPRDKPVIGGRNLAKSEGSTRNMRKNEENNYGNGLVLTQQNLWCYVNRQTLAYCVQLYA